MSSLTFTLDSIRNPSGACPISEPPRVRTPTQRPASRGRHVAGLQTSVNTHTHTHAPARAYVHARQRAHVRTCARAHTHARGKGSRVQFRGPAREGRTQPWHNLLREVFLNSQPAPQAADPPQPEPGVQQDGEFSFPLESVKKLKDLQELQEPGIRNHRKSGGPVVPKVCSHQKFPEELKPLCKEPNAPEILQRLEAIAEDPESCEICAFAACAGC
uniref:Guanylin n=1 Tax=Suricata suricatta TaxID=37032 RepID=A0A673TQS0_SURSU